MAIRLDNYRRRSSFGLIIYLNCFQLNSEDEGKIQPVKPGLTVKKIIADRSNVALVLLFRTTSESTTESKVRPVYSV